MEKDKPVKENRKLRAALRLSRIRNRDSSIIPGKKYPAAYSYLKASTGFIFAALFAGYAPAATPTISATPNPISSI